MTAPVPRRLSLGLATVAFAAALALGGCGGSPRIAAYTPPDPPPIPPAKPPPPPGFQAVQQAQPVSAVQETKISQLPLAPLTPLAPLAPASEAKLHVVRAGETVYAVSRLYGVPIRGVIDGNKLSPPYTLKIGQKLSIAQPRGHRVAPGDTVYGISRRYGVDMTLLVRLNQIAPPYRIAPGEQLLLPGQSVLGAKAPATMASATATPAVAEAVNGAGAVQQAAVTALPTRKPAPQSAAIPKPPPRAGSKFLWPVKGKVALGYGPKVDGLHNDGINIAAPLGTEVRAAENGVVAYAGNELRGFGNLLLIKHADGWMTAYAHTDAILVSRGQRVSRGQVVARVGDSGSVTAPQLHFEIRKGTRAVNPTGLLASKSAT
jgi:murein DD-endopeptidase MepM/ murein hydrolase activator NlpD